MADDAEIRIKLDATDASAGADQLGAKMLKVDKVAEGVNAALNDVRNSSKGVSDAIGAVGQSAAQAQGGVGKFGFVAQQAGFQIQDFATQVAGGQSALVALGQQAPQFLSIFGAGGAIVGAFVAVGAAIGSAFLPSLLSSKSALETLSEAAQKTAETLSTSKDGITEYSDEIQKLFKISQDAAKLKLTILLQEQNEALKEAKREFRELDDVILGLRGSFDFGVGDTADRLTKGVKATGDLRGAIIDLSSALEDFGRTGQDADIPKIEAAFLAVQKAGGFANKELFELSQTFLRFREGQISVEETTRLLNEALVDTSKITFDAAEAEKAEAQAKKEQAAADRERKQTLAELQEEIRRGLQLELNQINTLTQERIRTKALESQVIAQINSSEETREATAIQQRIASLNQEFELKAQRMRENGLLTQEIQAELNNQQILQEQILQEQLNTIRQEAAQRRSEIAQQEADRQAAIDHFMLMSKISIYEQMSSGILSLLSAFGSQSFKTQKKFAIAESLISIASGVAKALNNPYPANLGFAAQVAAKGAGLIKTIKSTDPAASSSGISFSGGSAPSIAPQPALNQPSEQNQQRVVNINIADDALITGSTVKKLFNSALQDTDLAVTINSSLQQASRVGAI